MQPLSKAQVDQWMMLLSEEQREFLKRSVGQSKKSKWLEVLAKKKGVTVSEDISTEELEEIIDDWVLVEILDSGFGNRDYRCICGKPLRYQYVVVNKKKGEKVGLGETCFEHHTSLSSEVVKDIIKEFHQIDLERDEILHKVATKQTFDIEPFLEVDTIPAIILEQALMGLPLTDKQVTYLKQLQYTYDRQQRLGKALGNLRPQARTFFEQLPNNQKNELLEKMIQHDYVREFPKGFEDDEINMFLSHGLPLLDSQIERIYLFNQQKKAEQAEKRRREESAYWQSVRDDRGASAPKRFQTAEKTVNYEMLIERHLETLRKVRKKEAELPEGMKRDWLKVQELVRVCKNGQTIDYSSFKLNLSMICYSLKIERDSYL